MVSVLGVGVAAATWPGDEPQTAYPAPAVSQPAAAIESPESSSEPSLRRTESPTPSAKASATRKPTAKPKVMTKAQPVVKPKPKPAPTPALKVVGTRYVTASLNVRTAPNFEADVVDVVSTGDKVSITSAIYNGFRFISYNDRGRWISNKYLSDKKPAVEPSGVSSSGGGISSASCSKSSSIQSGLVPNAIKVYRALCARYPQISSFGGRRVGDSGFHGTGRALDVMISNSSVGWDIANWTRANASQLGVTEVIYYQKIWTVQRSSEGWRPMSDRGSPTANHYDHVHVSVY